MNMTSVNIVKSNINEFRKFLNSFDHVFSDCDGVIWSKTPFPGSGKFFELMKKLGKTVHFVSNNSIRTKDNYEALFTASGIENGLENLTIPSTGILEFLKEKKFDKYIYCVACKETIRVLESNGFKCKYGPEVGADFYGEYVKYLEDDPDIGAVVLDSDFKINIPKIYKAIAYLKNPDVYFLCGATDKKVPVKSGLTVLGPGKFNDLIEEEVDREPIVIGKPSKLFGTFAMKRAGVQDASRVLFIGDMIDQDIGLGKTMGFNTLLLLTSITEDQMRSHETIKPDYFADSLGDIVPKLEEVINNV